MAKTKESHQSAEERRVAAKQLNRFVPANIVKDAFGRPSAIDLQTLQDLKYAFLLGCTNKEAALYAGISEQTYYNYVNGLPEDLKADFLGLVEGWKDDMILTARKTMRVAVSKAEHAKWLLERRRKDEFAPRTQHEVKEVSEFSDLSDEELEKIAAGGTD